MANCQYMLANSTILLWTMKSCPKEQAQTPNVLPVIGLAVKAYIIKAFKNFISMVISQTHYCWKQFPLFMMQIRLEKVACLQLHCCFCKSYQRQWKVSIVFLFSLKSIQSVLYASSAFEIPSKLAVDLGQFCHCLTDQL